jgi:hypothetical protein
MKTIIETPAQAKETRHIEGVQFRCHDCHEVKPVQHSGGTGYARCNDPDGEHLVCYACADKRQTADLITHKKFTAYISGDGHRLTTWTGGNLGRVFLGERHPWSRERHYLTARDVHGQRWHGTGAPGMWASLTKCKA